MYPLNVIIIVQEFGLCNYLYIFIGIIDLLYIFTRMTTFLTAFLQEKGTIWLMNLDYHSAKVNSMLCCT